MIITNPETFDSLSKNLFKHHNFKSLRDTALPRIRFTFENDIDEQKNDYVIFNQVSNIFNEIFSGKDLWLRITFWDKNFDLFDLAIPPKYQKFYTNTEEEKIVYVYIPEYSISLIAPILQSIIGYELATDLGKNIQCFFYDFNSSAVANLYDDRGMDIVTNNSDLIKIINEKFKHIIF
jgi:hypothetical protein